MIIYSFSDLMLLVIVILLFFLVLNKMFKELWLYGRS
jgi:hypothetical protein